MAENSPIFLATPRRRPAEWLPVLLAPVALGGLEVAVARASWCGPALAAALLAALSAAGWWLLLGWLHGTGSERKRLEYSLQQKNRALERALKTKDVFLAAVSHELRTPLNAIIGFSGTLLMGLGGPLTQRQKTQLETIRRSANGQLTLINNLLDFARIESGEVLISPEPLLCQEIVREVAEVFRPLAEGKSLRLHVESPPQPITLHADRRALSQILTNLAANAITFTEQGEVRLELREQGAHLEFSVSDTGVGIPPGEHGRIFEAFAEFSGRSALPHGGAGLGLYLSGKLAALLGGRIQCASAPGEGSRFTLVLPQAAREVA